MPLLEQIVWFVGVYDATAAILLLLVPLKSIHQWGDDGPSSFDGPPVTNSRTATWERLAHREAARVPILSGVSNAAATSVCVPWRRSLDGPRRLRSREPQDHQAETAAPASLVPGRESLPTRRSRLPKQRAFPPWQPVMKPPES